MAWGGGTPGPSALEREFIEAAVRQTSTAEAG